MPTLIRPTDLASRTPLRLALAAAIGCAMLLAVAAPVAPAASPPPPGSRPESDDLRRDATVRAIEAVLPAVVNIGTFGTARSDPYEELWREFFGYGRRAPDTLYSSGSGVIIDEEGWVLTNFHVVRGAARVRVTVADSDEPLDAEIVSVSEINDLALLRLKPAEPRTFRAVSLADDDDLLLGETVLALGNPYGLGGSVSRGILSAKTRRPERDGESMEVEDWLQTDASINPGNSGGPLVNLRGELIGLNVAILARAQGIGFAIPVKRIVAALSEMFSPEATHGLWFGATVHGTRPPLVITDIQRGSPADSAGLEPGDEIVSIDGRQPRSFLHVYRQLAGAPRDARIVVRRGERDHEVDVRLLAEKSVFDADYFRRRLGLATERLPADLARQLRLAPSSALLVSSVEKGGPADRAGLARGHILVAIEGQPASDPVAVGRLLNRKRAGDTVTVDFLAARRRGMLLQISEGRSEIRLR